MRLTFILLLMISCLSACTDKPKWQSPHPYTENERWVAHAGGLVNGMDHTDCLEGLSACAKQHVHLIELDFEWTKDGKLVLLHDWKNSIKRIYGETPGQRTLAEFKAMKKANTVTPISAEELFAWLDSHPNILIIAELKSQEVKSLQWIQEHYPSYAERIIPEINNFSSYEPVRKLGFYRIILNLWGMNKSDRAITKFCKSHPVWAVSVLGKRALHGKLTHDLTRLHIPVYAFTINDADNIQQLFKAGVFGIYTDSYQLKQTSK